VRAPARKDVHVAEPSGIARRRETARSEGGPAYLQRREDLVRAAATVFKAKGLQRANLGDIALQAGVDRASVYYYVSSKEELFHEVVRDAVEDNLRRARAIRDSPGPAPERLRALVHDLMRAYAEHYPILYVFVQENLSHVTGRDAAWAADMRRGNNEYAQIVVDLVQAGYDEGSMVERGPAWVVAYGVMGMVGWTNRWFNPGETPVDAAAIGAAFADCVLLGLVAPPG
jgi:AcrR family transcriptional regulator